MKSLLLDRTVWDLVLDADGNIAVASEPYSRTQDVACACRLFKGELWYSTKKGIPYFAEILGKRPSFSLVKEYLNQAALTVPGVVSSQVIFSGFTRRGLSGQIQYIDETGAVNGVSF